MWSLRYAGLLDGPGRVRVPYNAVAGLMRDGVPAEQIGSPVELGNVDWQQRWRAIEPGSTTADREMCRAPRRAGTP